MEKPMGQENESTTSDTGEPPPKGFPGGVALPAVIGLSSATVFMVCWADPELVDLGPHFSASGLGLLGAAASFFWFLLAAVKRPATDAPPPPPGGWGS